MWPTRSKTPVNLDFPQNGTAGRGTVRRKSPGVAGLVYTGKGVKRAVSGMQFTYTLILYQFLEITNRLVIVIVVVLGFFSEVWVKNGGQKVPLPPLQTRCRGHQSSSRTLQPNILFLLF